MTVPITDLFEDSIKADFLDNKNDYKNNKNDYKNNKNDYKNNKNDYKNNKNSVSITINPINKELRLNLKISTSNNVFTIDFDECMDNEELKAPEWVK